MVNYCAIETLLIFQQIPMVARKGEEYAAWSCRVQKGDGENGVCLYERCAVNTYCR